MASPTYNIQEENHNMFAKDQGTDPSQSVSDYVELQSASIN